NFDDRLIARNDAADREEARLHDRVGAIAELVRFGDLVGVNRINSDLFRDDDFLDCAGQMFPNLCRFIRAVQEQGRTVCGRVENLVTLQKIELVDSNEVCALYQIGALDRLRTKAQVRHGHRAGLLRVVNKIALRIVGRFLANNLDRVLVRADRAVGSQAPEQCSHLSGGFSGEIRVVGQAVEGDVIFNTDAEMVLRLVLHHFIENTFDHGRGEFFRAQTIAPTDEPGHRGTRILRLSFTGGTPGPRFTNCRYHVLIEWFSGASRLLCAIQNG